ncbi:unnamed protein product [Orchesella dallaii]|uniref:Uncharacterized protein n=1 Tax=Orchesella dallaii TaxID=48710 RepID=A0ABP1R0T6_9HEXA
MWLIALQIQQINSQSIVLDLNSNASKEWIEISCVYSNDYNDFWVFGYPVTVDEERFPAQKGYWTPGTAEKCEIHYYGGPNLAKAKSLTFDLYLKGTSPKIEVRANPTPLITDFYSIPIGEITEAAGQGWINPKIEIDQSQEAWVFSIVLTSSANDHFLLDKITVDLGDDVPAPTTSTTTPTEPPIRDELVTLRTDRDYLNVWETNCHYSDDYVYLASFGKDCAVNPTSEIPPEFSGIGFWTPCAGKACRIRYISNSSVVSRVPSSLSLQTYSQGSASVQITMQELKHADSDLDCANCQLIRNEVMEEDDGWKPTTVGLLKNPGEHYIVNIDLEAGPGEVVMLNQATITLTEMITTEPPSTTPTTTTVRTSTPPGGTGSTGTGSPATDTTTAEASASKLLLKETMFAQILMLCVYLILGK